MITKSETNIEEIWLSLPKYSKYAVSNLGRIKSFKGGVSILLKPTITRGYYYAGLYSKGVQDRQRIHRLVAEAFIYNPDRKPYVDHIDGDKTNNNATNLRWVTQKENINFASARGTLSRGEKHWKAVLTEDIVKTIRRMGKTGKFTHAEIGRKLNCNRKTVTDIIRYKSWRHI